MSYIRFMAIYKIFPEKDTFISKHRNTQNFGRDEVLEISNETDITSLNPDVTRTLIKFPTSQITDVLTNMVSGSFTSNLKLFLANATLPVEYDIYAYPLSQTWDMGLGKSADRPITITGVNWDTLPSYNTSSFSSQLFTYSDSKDINIDLTNIVSQWYSSSIDNNGIILKLSSSIEDSTTPLIAKFFSMDTHTIYPPQLEFKWDDSSYNTSLTQVESSNISTLITNNKSFYPEGTNHTFRIKTRNKYPSRAFTTSSVYTDVKALPITSYWALKDEKTEEIIIDFDDNFTKISCDNTSNYFTINMSGLEPERFYRILYKVVFPNGEISIIEEKWNYFKVVR